MLNICQVFFDHYAASGAAITVHTFGDFQQFYPHLHIIATNGCFSGSNAITMRPCPVAKDLELLFRYNVFKMLQAEGKITNAVIENMMGWHHSGFNVCCGLSIWPNNVKGLEDLARYIIRVCFSQECMTYILSIAGSDGGAKMIHRSKDGKIRIFLALWIGWSSCATHTPNRYEQMVRYYGYYLNKSRGMRKKARMDDQVPAY